MKVVLQSPIQSDYQTNNLATLGSLKVTFFQRQLTVNAEYLLQITKIQDGSNIEDPEIDKREKNRKQIP